MLAGGFREFSWCALGTAGGGGGDIEYSESSGLFYTDRAASDAVVISLKEFLVVQAPLVAMVVESTDHVT